MVTGFAWQNLYCMLRRIWSAIALQSRILFYIFLLWLRYCIIESGGYDGSKKCLILTYETMRGWDNPLWGDKRASTRLFIFEEKSYLPGPRPRSTDLPSNDSFSFYVVLQEPCPTLGLFWKEGVKASNLENKFCNTLFRFISVSYLSLFLRFQTFKITVSTIITMS